MIKSGFWATARSRYETAKTSKVGIFLLLLSLNNSVSLKLDKQRHGL